MTSSSKGKIEGIGHFLVGEGPEKVLVLHDWNGDHTTYDPILPYLDTKAFSYAFADLRGYGTSRDLKGTYTVREIADDCLALADRLSWQRFQLIGHSMTGMVTQRLASDAPSRIKSAIAVCPMSAQGSPASAEALAFFATTSRSEENFCRLIKFVTGLSDGWAKAKWRDYRRNVDLECRDAYLAMFTKTNFVDDVRGLKTPCLVVIGDKDPGLDEAAMKTTFLAWHPNAELSVIRNSGHYPMQECPPVFAMVIEDYLRKQMDR